ncbi:MAG: alpha/beta hydrolase [Leptospiraceae bacterium]|nr:alpha/beta hydrolase [Leptospiraceae bacterium]MCP5499164.1 alpha/beta hydrolase [Leptospiraceae bacterium]
MDEFEGKVKSNGIHLHVRYLPDGDKTPIVLVMGLGFQMTSWPENLLELLQKHSYPVLLFDNRDVGLSEEIPYKKQDNILLSLLQYRFQFAMQHAYSLTDMVEDTIGLLDHFELKKVHLLGISMGGMISQILSSKYPDRVKTLTLLATSDNSTDNPIPSIDTLWKFLGSGISGHDLESVKRRRLLLIKAIRSPGFRQKSDEELLTIIEKGYFRSYKPEGLNRQLHAILSTGSLRNYYPSLKVPTMIVHGKEDPLIHYSCAQNLARYISNARLHLIDGLGHDLPEDFMPVLVNLLLSHTKEE